MAKKYFVREDSTGINSLDNGPAPQELSFSSATGQLSIDNGGNSVSLDGRYSLIEHTHTIADVTGLQSALDSKVAKTLSITSGYGITASSDFSSPISIEINTSVLDSRYLRKDVDDDSSFTLTLGSVVSDNITINSDLTLGSLSTGSMSDQFLTIDSNGLVKKTNLVIPDFSFDVTDASGSIQFDIGGGDNLSFEGAGDTSISFNPSTKKITITSIPGSGTGGAVTSWNSRVGGVNPEEGDYNTDLVPELTGATNLYFTEARAISSILTGFTTGSNSTVLATDTLLQGLGKLQGQLNNKVNQSTTLTLNGTTSNITVSGGTQNLSGNRSWDINLAATGVTGGTYPKVTVDTFGRVTAGANLATSDIPNLPTSKITSGVFSVARLGSGTAGAGKYVDGGTGAWTDLPALPVVNDGTLTVSTSGIATGSGSFTANQSTASTITIDVPGTNITQGTRTTTSVPLTSSTGTGLTLSAASTTLAGVMTSAMVVKLNGLDGSLYELLANKSVNFTSINDTLYPSTKAVNDYLIANYTPSIRTLTAGNGLSGGGDFTANRTFTLGTPSSITLSSTNSVTSTSHTHAFAPGGTTSQYIRGDGSLASFPSIPTVNNGTLTLATSGIATGFATFTANQSTAATFTVNVPATNIAQGTRTSTTVPITSSTGTDATLNVATSSLAGVMSAADKSKLDGLNGSLYELLSNKATSFSTLNNTLYPTTQAVADYVTAQIPVAQTLGITSTGAITLSGGGGAVTPNKLAKLAIDWSAIDYSEVRGYFNSSGTASPVAGNTYFGLVIPHTNLYGANLAFRNGSAWFQTMENGVLGDWLRLADRSWVDGSYVNLTSAQYIGGTKTFNGLLRTGSSSVADNSRWGFSSLPLNGAYSAQLENDLISSLPNTFSEYYAFASTNTTTWPLLYAKDGTTFHHINTKRFYTNGAGIQWAYPYLTTTDTNVLTNATPLFRFSGTTNTYGDWQKVASREWSAGNFVSTSNSIGSQSASVSNFDANAADKTSAHYISGSNTPYASGFIFNNIYSTAGSQIFIPNTTTDSLYYRGKSSGTWGSWEQAASRNWVGTQLQLSRGSLAGQIAISGGNDVSLSSLNRLGLTDANDFSQPAGLYSIYNTTGSTNFPVATGAGIRLIRTTGSTAGYFELWHDSGVGNLIYYRAGSGDYEIIADRDWVSSWVSGSYLPLAGGTLTGNLNTPSMVLSDAISFPSNGKINPISDSKLSAGMYGKYNISKLGHIWGMSTSYSISNDGSDFGNSYGLVYGYKGSSGNINIPSYMPTGHQIMFVNNGTAYASIGLTGFAYFAQNVTVGSLVSSGAVSGTTGSFTGNVTAATTPTAASHLANKAYVDGLIDSTTLQSVTDNGNSTTNSIQIEIDSGSPFIDLTKNGLALTKASVGSGPTALSGGGISLIQSGINYNILNFAYNPTTSNTIAELKGLFETSDPTTPKSVVNRSYVDDLTAVSYKSNIVQPHNPYLIPAGTSSGQTFNIQTNLELNDVKLFVDVPNSINQGPAAYELQIVIQLPRLKGSSYNEIFNIRAKMNVEGYNANYYNVGSITSTNVDSTSYDMPSGTISYATYVIRSYVTVTTSQIDVSIGDVTLAKNVSRGGVGLSITPTITPDTLYNFRIDIDGTYGTDYSDALNSMRLLSIKTIKLY